MKYAAVIDTNILVSALLSRNAASPPTQIMERVFKGAILPVYSFSIMRAYYLVLRRKKFLFSEPLINNMLGAIEQHGMTVEPVKSNIWLADESDRIFYDAAITSNAVLVTGNIKHYPSVPFIMKPAAYLITYGASTS